MDRIRRNPFTDLDWVSVLLYLMLVLLGWLNIFAAVYDPEVKKTIFDLSLNSGKQLLWIALASVLALFILLFNANLYFVLSYVVYAATMLLLVGVLLFGREVAGSKSWFEVGFGFRLQPAEFAKLATALAIARFFGEPSKKISNRKHLMGALAIIALPMALIILQGDTGSALVFLAFAIVLYREGLPDYVLGLGLLAVLLFVLTLVFKEKYFWEFAAVVAACGLCYGLFFTNRKPKQLLAPALVTGLSLGLVFSVDFAVRNILKPHQQRRLEILVNPDIDIKGVGWQVQQSKVAIGSGGLTGKGFLEGTQTKFNFVPDQSTDFIFCTIGEEHGWAGSLFVLGLFVAFLNRLVIVAERQKSRFSRVYGYSVVAVLFFHFTVNIGMTMGLFPVIGIPLPFFSYGGSSLWAFSILLFILLRLDMQRKQISFNY